MARASIPASSSLAFTQLCMNDDVSRAEQCVMIGPLSVVMICSRSGLATPLSSEMTSGSAADSDEERPKSLQEGGVDVADVGVDGVFDGVHQSVGQPQRIALSQTLPRAELVVDGLAADARRAGHVGQRYRRPVAAEQQLPHRVEHRITQKGP